MRLDRPRLVRSDLLMNLTQEMVQHGIVEYDKIVAAPADVLTKLCEFLDYRFAGREDAGDAGNLASVDMPRDVALRVCCQHRK
jgi:hypothetical protein